MANRTGYQAGYRPPQPVPPRQANGPSQANVARRAMAGSQRAGAADRPAPRANGTAKRGANNGGSGRRPPTRSNGRRKKMPPMILFFVVVLGTALLVLGAFTAKLVIDINEQGNDVFYQGVYVANVPLGGMTVEQAQQALQNMEQSQLDNWAVTLQFPSDTKQIKASHIDLRMDLGQQLTAAWNVGRSGSLIERQRVINGLKVQPFYTQGGISFSEDKLNNILAELAKGIKRDPVDATATFTPEEEHPFSFTDEVPGRALDVAPLKEQILQAVYSLQSATIEPQLAYTQPQQTKAGLQANMTCIVVVTTEISSKSEPGRNENIRIALERLNGTRLMPKEKVSTNKVFGKRTKGNGYQEAPEIAYGEYVPGVGGGVCQVSTTLYQAVLRAGLEVITRERHTIPSNYAKKGQDATVSDNGADLVFRNNTEYPVYIRGRLTQANDKAKTLRCEVSIYGRALPDGIRYVLDSRQLREIPMPEEVQREDNGQKNGLYYQDEQKLVAGRVGYEVETYLVAQKDGLEVSRELITTDIYPERAPVLWYGTHQREDFVGDEVIY